MMRMSLLFLTSIILPLLAGCGGGDTQVAEGGIGGTGVSQGKVSGYGSLFVNGVEFNTDNASFVIEEDDSSTYSQADIKLGMVVQVTGESDGVSGTATRVEYHDQLEGVLTAAPQLDADGVGTLEIMRQIVEVDTATVFDDATQQQLQITDLVEGDLVEVSGYSDGSGKVFATRIELKRRDWTNNSGIPLELKGVITNLNGTLFDLGGLTVDFSQALSLPDGAPQEGWYVEVKGEGFASDGSFIATEVELEGDGDLLVADDDEKVELEGVVTAPLDGDTFSLNGQPVSIAEISIDTAKITEGRELEVEGQMIDGVLVASEIEFEADESELQEIASSVEDINTTDLNSGTLTLLGQQIQVTSSTIMEDDSAGGDDQSFNLNEIQADDYIHLDVYHDGSAWMVLKLEREDLEEPLTHEIEGVVEDVNPDNPNRITVLGIVVDISATGIQPVNGDRVELSGEFFDGVVLWADSLELED